MTEERRKVLQRIIDTARAACASHRQWQENLCLETHMMLTADMQLLTESVDAFDALNLKEDPEPPRPTDEVVRIEPLKY